PRSHVPHHDMSPDVEGSETGSIGAPGNRHHLVRFQELWVTELEQASPFSGDGIPDNHYSVDMARGQARTISTPGNRLCERDPALLWLARAAVFSNGLPRDGVPDLDRTVLARRGQAPAVPIPPHRKHPIGMSLKGEGVRARGGVPDLERAVLTGRGQ